MSDEKDPAGEAADDAIQDAMAEAVASMEAREDGDEKPTDGKPSAADAVTEALIDAKKELEEVLEQTQKEAGSFREKWLRAAADLENYRKRAARERDDVAKFGNEKLLKDFLPIVDDLERSIDVVAQSEVGDTGQQLLDGVKLVLKKFLSQLEKNGVTTFDSVGETFDPSQHEAVQQVHADRPQGQVHTQLQRGFMINDRLLRPAMVVVSLGPEGGSKGDGGEG